MKIITGMAVLSFLVVPSSGQEPVSVLGVSAPGGDWTAASPEGAHRDDNPTSTEKARFWERLHGEALDLCERVPLAVDESQTAGGLLRINGHLARLLLRYPNRKLALADEFRPGLAIGYTPFIFSAPAEGFGLSISVSSQLQGDSVVIRPLQSEKSCKELKRLVNVFGYKTVAPLTAKRIAAMETGELWKMGLTFQVGLQASVGAGSGHLSVSLSAGRGHQNTESVTLYRMSPDKLRFRLRLDRADITSLGGSLVASITPVQLGLQVGEDLFADELGKQVSGWAESGLNSLIAKQLSSYLRASLSLSESVRTGQQSVLEFVLDPNDQEQIQALARTLRGNILSLKELKRLLKPINGLTPKDVRHDLEELEEGHADPLESQSTFAAADAYRRDSRNLSLHLPLFFSHQSSWVTDRDRIVLLDGQGGEINVYPTEKRISNSFLDLPIMGKYSVHDLSRSAQVYSAKNDAGKDPTPAFVYLQQEGFKREPAGSAKALAQRADDILRYAGVRGRGVNERTRLPIETLFPSPAPEAQFYKSAVVALTVVFSQNAVRDILRAGPDDVIRSYANSLDYAGKAVLDQVLALPDTRVSPDGRIHYDVSSLPRSISGRDEQDTRSYAWMLADAAAGIVADLDKARREKTPEKQSLALRKIIAGSGESGLAYEDILKVLVQLVDPLDLKAEFYINVRKGIKGEKDINARYLLDGKKIADEMDLAAMMAARKRFIQPARLTD